MDSLNKRHHRQQKSGFDEANLSEDSTLWCQVICHDGFILPGVLLEVWFNSALEFQSDKKCLSLKQKHSQSSELCSAVAAGTL